jgi:FkbM family methyltransferase
MSIPADFLKNVIRQNHNTRAMKLGKKVANNFLTSYWNEAYFDMQKNGEFYLIQAAQAYFSNQKITIFDVGANHGDWAIFAKKTLPNSTIHCFEIVPQTFSILSEKLGAYEGILSNNIGLSDQAQEIQVTCFSGEDSGSSIQALPWGIDSEAVTCRVIPGDQYCREKGIDGIDFLKVDTEGHELSVLKGLNDLLKSGKIALIQFEYGLTYIPSRVTLGDVYNLLSPYGYEIGRLYPKGVEFKQYDLFHDENFKLGNYVAVHQSAQELLQKISL